MTDTEEAIRQAKERGTWDRRAAGYDSGTLQRFKNAYELSIEKARSVVSRGDRVLEIGCGTGILSLGIARDVERVIGTDISPEMIGVARRKAQRAGVSNVEFHVHDGYALPYDDASFDTVLLFNVLHVVKEPASVLTEAHRLLKPGGHLVTATDCYAEPVPVATRLMLTAQKLLRVSGMVPFLWYYHTTDLHRLFEQNSFAVVDSAVLHLAPVNYYLLGSKERG